MKIYAKKINLLFWNIRIYTRFKNTKVMIKARNKIPLGIQKEFEINTASLGNVISTIPGYASKILQDHLNITNKRVLKKIINEIKEGDYFIRYDDEEYGFLFSSIGLKRNVHISEVENDVIMEIVIKTDE